MMKDLENLGKEHLKVKSKLLKVQVEMKKMKTKELDIIKKLNENDQRRATGLGYLATMEGEEKEYLYNQLLVKEQTELNEALNKVRINLIEAAELAEPLETEKSQLVEVYNMQVRINQPDQLNIYQAFYS